MKNVAFILMFLLLPSMAFARSNRVGQVPHGNDFGCDICHTSAGGLTNFGFDSFTYTENGVVNWGNLSKKDSDGDGYPNGLELGDPNGTWKSGNATPGGSYTDPNDADDNFCGDGKMQPNEECEGSNLNGETCSSLNLGDGNLGCTNRCVFDVAVCGGCGNNVKQNDEECDGTDLAGATCDTLGFEGGTVSCGTNCRLITSACTGDGHGSVSALCGNGTRDVGETCDRSDLGGATCQSLGYTGGFLGCGDTCTFDVSGCTSFGTSSGDGTTTIDDTSADNGLQPSGADFDGGTNLSFEGKACSTVGGDFPLLALFALFGLRRRR